jgi:hypothetical protein
MYTLHYIHSILCTCIYYILYVLYTIYTTLYITYTHIQPAVNTHITQVLHLSFKSRWSKFEAGRAGQPPALWMSYREAVHIAKIVFGGDNENMIRDFMALVTPQMQVRTVCAVYYIL